MKEEKSWSDGDSKKSDQINDGGKEEKKDHFESDNNRVDIIIGANKSQEINNNQIKNEESQDDNEEDGDGSDGDDGDGEDGEEEQEEQEQEGQQKQQHFLQKTLKEKHEPVYPFFGGNLPPTTKIIALSCLEYLDGPSLYSVSCVNHLWNRAVMDDALWE